MKIKQICTAGILISLSIITACTKDSKTDLLSNPALKLIPQDASAFMFSDYSVPAAKKLRESPAIKNSASQIEEQVAKLKEVDPKLADAMQSVMKAMPGNLASPDSSVEKMLAYYRPITGQESTSDVAVRVDFAHEKDVSQLIENIKKGILTGITATSIEEGLKIEAIQNSGSPITFYVCNTATAVVASILKTSCKSFLGEPLAETTLAPIITGIPRDAVDMTTTMIAGANLGQLVAQSAMANPVSAEIPKEAPVQNAYITSGFNGGITTSIDVFFVKEDPKVESVANQFKEYVGKTVSHHTPDSSPASLSIHIPSGLSADLNAVLGLVAPSLGSISIHSLACGIFENPEGSIPALACALEAKDGEALVAELKTQAAGLISAQTGLTPSWQESVTEGIKTATFMTPLGFGISLGAKGTTALIGTTLQSLKEMDHGAVSKNTLAPSAPLYGHINGAALAELIKSSLESAKLFGVDTTPYEDSFKALEAYSDIYFSAEVIENRVRAKAVANFKKAE